MTAVRVFQLCHTNTTQLSFFYSVTVGQRMIVNSAATLRHIVGNEDFAQFINGHYYYVDKTQYLKEIFQYTT